MFKFDHTKYVPVLRYKDSEKTALRKLPMKIRSRISPLLDISPNIITPKPIKDRSGNIIGEKPVKYEEIFPRIIKGIQSFWGFLPFFVDFELLERLLVYPKGNHPANMVCKAAIAEKMPMIMVTGLSRSPDYNSIVLEYSKKTKKGICLRLTVNDLQDTSLQKKITEILFDFDIPYSYVDLIVDLQLIQRNATNFREIINLIPKINSWRTFTIISGAFPKDLSGFDKNQEYEIDRSDWNYWLEQIQQSGIIRIPSFGDYTIQHPYYDHNPPKFPNVSASIRYTYEKYWVLMRGEGISNSDGAGFEQYWGQAALLCDRSEYCGVDYSDGDRCISDIANQNNVKGSPRTLLWAGINHHLTYTVKQIARTFGILNIEEPKDGLSLGPRPRQGGSRGQHASLNGSHQLFLFPQGE